MFQVDKEKRELQSALRTAKTDLLKKNEELVDVQEELATLRESSKEREKVLKAKYRAATEEGERLAGIEVSASKIDTPQGPDCGPGGAGVLQDYRVIVSSTHQEGQELCKGSKRKCTARRRRHCRNL